MKIELYTQSNLLDWIAINGHITYIKLDTIDVQGCKKSEWTIYKNINIKNLLKHLTKLRNLTEEELFLMCL